LPALRASSQLGTLQAMTTVDDAEHVGLKEAATILGVHPNTVRNRITSGKLPAIKGPLQRFVQKWAIWLITGSVVLPARFLTE